MGAVDSRSPALARASKRTAQSITGAGVAVAGTTGVVTLTAGFLDDLQNGDVVTLSAITGGGTMLEGDYYITGMATTPAAGATTCAFSLTPDGPVVVPSVAITAGTLTKGKVLPAEGVLAGDYGPSPLSAKGR